MLIKCHKKVGANLNLFLTSQGYRCVWNTINKDTDELVVLGYKKSDETFLKAVKKEVESTGYIPYHYLFKFSHKTKEKVEDTKVSFSGEVLDSKTIPNLNGGFQLVAFAGDDGLNYLWKCYDLTKEMPSGRVDITARMKATIVTPTKSVVNLINYVRTGDKTKKC